MQIWGWPEKTSPRWQLAWRSGGWALPRVCRAEGVVDVDPQSGRAPACLRSGQVARAALERKWQAVEPERV